MSDIAIRVEGLGKRYRIGKLLRYNTLRDSLAEAVRILEDIARLAQGHFPGEVKLIPVFQISPHLRR